jgi:hypothetical protein
MNALFKKWLDIGGKLDQSQKLECPSCGKTAIDFQYVGNPSTRKGYLDIWCRACLKGLHVDVRIPENAAMLDVNASPDIVAARIPAFTWVLPDE